MSILQNCFTLNMQVGIWLGHKLDKSTTMRVTKDSNANMDAVRVNKHLIAKEALAPLISAASALRVHFYKATLPWKDNGDRLIPRPAYHQRFIGEHAELKERFEQKVQEFFDEGYPRAMEQAEFRMGDLYDPKDYPTVSRLRHLFYVNLDVDGVSPTFDFRLEKDASILQKRVNTA